MCRRDHWCRIILAPLIYYENVLLVYYPSSGLWKSTKVLFHNTQKYLHCFVYIGLAQCWKSCTCMQLSLHCSYTDDWGMLIRYLDYMWVYNTCMVSKILQCAMSCINLLHSTVWWTCYAAWWTSCYACIVNRKLTTYCPTIKLNYVDI